MGALKIRSTLNEMGDHRSGNKEKRRSILGSGNGTRARLQIIKDEKEIRGGGRRGKVGQGIPVSVDSVLGVLSLEEERGESAITFRPWASRILARQDNL